MKTYEILDKGKQILQTDINLYKDYYQQFHDQIKSQNDLDSSIEFELQYLKYMMYVEDNYKEVILEAQRLATLPNITVYTLSKVNRTLGVAYYHIGEYKLAMESYIESVKLLNNIVLKNDTQCYELGLSYYNISLLYKNEANTNEFDLVLFENFYDNKFRRSFRPPWTSDMSAEQIDQQERTSFLDWRRRLAL